MLRDDSHVTKNHCEFPHPHKNSHHYIIIRINYFIYQIECLLTAQQIIWKHQKNLSESNNNLIESENNNLMCLSCSKYNSSSNILTNFMEEVQHLSSG